jgi:hypothetical protein
MKYGVVEVELHVFLTLALAGRERSALRPGRFTHGKIPSDTHLIGQWVGLGTDMDACEKTKNSVHCRRSNPDFS